MKIIKLVGKKYYLKTLVPEEVTDRYVGWLNVLRGKEYSYKRIFKSGRAVRCLSECYFGMKELDHENR